MSLSKSMACDVLVVGDEVESILTAVSAARAGASTVLVRRSIGRLGGLSVRGGLSYMDITPECITGLFAEFLQRAGVVRIALNPDRAHQVLCDLLAEAGIDVLSGVDVSVSLTADGFPETVRLQPVKSDARYFKKPGQEPAPRCEEYAPVKKEQTLHPGVVIDATPDADMVRALGVPHITGLGGLFGEARNFLGISPVFRLIGIPVPALQTFEQSLRDHSGLAAILDKALPMHPPDLRREYLTRPTFAPADQDYLDILNPVIGIDYHIWRHGDAATYPDAGIFIDGANISRLADGSLGFNGLVVQPGALKLRSEDLLALSRGAAIPEMLQQEMGFVERYFRERAGFSEAQLILPEAMYVRQTFTLLAKKNMTARQAIQGGVPAEQAIGSFSYWLDLRGAPLWKVFPGAELPKPFFNVGLDVALPNPKHSRLQNIAFVGRSAGYSPIGQGAGRIVQHNALLGEGLGLAAALAVQEKKPLAAMFTELTRIQECLKLRHHSGLRCDGQPVAMPDASQCPVTHALLRKEAAIVSSFEASAVLL